MLPIPPDTHWSEVKPIVLPGADEEPEPRKKPRKAPAAHVRATRPANVPPGGIWWAPPAEPAPARREPKREPSPKPARKNNPRLIAAARELRDRYLDALANDPSVLMPRGKYDLARALPAADTRSAFIDVKALPQAA